MFMWSISTSIGARALRYLANTAVIGYTQKIVASSVGENQSINGDASLQRKTPRLLFLNLPDGKISDLSV